MDYYFTGRVERIIFENASNFFKILLLELEETDSDFEDFELIVTGTMADIIEGETYTFWGSLTQHPRYGEQVKASRYERSKPTASGLVAYFSSEHFKGIGKKTAQKIVDIYGDNAIDKILADPEPLTTIKGLTADKRQAFLDRLRLNYGTEQILAKLAEYGLTNRLAFQIFNTYDQETLTVIQENPYQLVEDIQGIGFKIADQLAKRLGIEDDSPARFRAALVHCLTQTCLEEGDTYVESRLLLEKSLTLLEEARDLALDPSLVAQELSNLIALDKVQQLGTKIFSNSLYYAEEGIAKNLMRIIDAPLQKVLEAEEIAQEIQRIEDKFDIRYDQTQKRAIAQALTSRIFILTGGPGTGKTTVIRGLIEAYAHIHGIDLHKKDIPIVLAAPTGRAARRMNELTGLASATIHRHLGLTGDDQDSQGAADYLDCDLIIVDEFSMVDTWLANQLFSALATGTQVILVGDQDQLPSVGPGQVLADLLRLADLPQIALTKIFRQGDDSTIVTLASQMRQGFLPADFTQKKPDRSYFEAQPGQIPDLIEKILSAALRSGIPAQDIQVLAPMYRGQAGITNLNQLLQELINPKTDQEFLFNDLTFRQGDKVLHLVNDAEANVFNGDVGYITGLVPAKYTESKQDELILNFEGNEVVYPRSDWQRITLAYAMSIHKSQGSEFPVVILPLTQQSYRMLQRNLIYTAVTRSKSKLILLGEYTAFDLAVRQEGAKRQTYLTQRFSADQSTEKNEETRTEESRSDLSDRLETEPEAQPIDQPASYVLTPNNYLTIDPMIGISQAEIEAIFKPVKKG